MAETKKRDIRISDVFWKEIGRISRDFGYSDHRGEGQSQFIRDVVSDAVAEWKLAPYTASNFRNWVFVDKNGNLFYRAVQQIELNTPRLKMPFIVVQKTEKRRHYENVCPKSDTRTEWLQKQWHANYFGVWAGHHDRPEEARDSLIAEAVDRRGVGEKTVDLEINQDAHTPLTRETIAVLKHYVQWSGDADGDYDRVDIPLDIPCRHLSIEIIVDKDLYRNTRNIRPRLALELRNREGARFYNREILGFLERVPEEVEGIYPSDERIYRTEIKRLEESFQLEARRLRSLAHSTIEAESGTEQIVKSAESREIMTRLRMPEKYLFYKVDWHSPHLGIVTCVNWRKPTRFPGIT